MHSLKSFFLPAAATILLLTSCSKSDSSDRCIVPSTAAPSTEVNALQAYISSNGITAAADARGFFYTISRAGDTAKRPSLCSSVKVSYTGRFTNGNQFDAGNNATFVLGNLILGWQEGIPLIGKGGSLILYLPPSLAYGASGSGSIPANANLVFAIDLVDVF